ncbi:GLUG motif-containing protein [Methanohalophilus sp.]
MILIAYSTFRAESSIHKAFPTYLQDNWLSLPLHFPLLVIYSHVGSLVGNNNRGTIENSSAAGDVCYEAQDL